MGCTAKFRNKSHEICTFWFCFNLEQTTMGVPAVKAMKANLSILFIYLKGQPTLMNILLQHRCSHVRVNHRANFHLSLMAGSIDLSIGAPCLKFAVPATQDTCCSCLSFINKVAFSQGTLKKQSINAK